MEKKKGLFFQEDFIRELFEGNYSPADNVVPDNPEYKEIKDKIHEEWEYFEQKMTGGDKDRLKQLQDLIADLQYMEEYAFFKEGLKTGKLPFAI